MPHRHADGGLYRRLRPTHTPADQDRICWVPDEDEEAPIGRGGEVVLYLPNSGGMPADLAAEGFTCYATPMSRWERRFEDVTPAFGGAIRMSQALFAAEDGEWIGVEE